MAGNSSKKNTFASNAIIVLVLIFSITCLIGFVVSIITFANSQKEFNESYTATLNQIANSSVSDVKTAQMAIEHMERLQKLQNDTSTNNVMSFLYTMLSSVLVGLCAGFVAKSYNLVEKSKDAAKKSEEKSESSAEHSNKAKEYLDAVSKVYEQIKKILVDSEEKLELSKKYADNAKEYTTKVSMFHSQLTDLLTKSNELYRTATNDKELLKETIQVLTIHIEIIQAHAALSAHSKIIANQRFYNIKKMVLQIKSTVKKDIILQLQQELLMLKSAVEEFEFWVQDIDDKKKKESYLIAIQRYCENVDASVNYCSKILQTAHS